jgi:hypothetical protein
MCCRGTKTEQSGRITQVTFRADLTVFKKKRRKIKRKTHFVTVAQRQN